MTIVGPVDLPASVDVAEEVSSALAHQRAVVALESTIFSELGLPAPANLEGLDRVLAALRARSVIPALTAVLDGRPTIGVGESYHPTICGPTQKVAARDLGVATGQRWPYGATTVSASVTLANAVGIPVFATGGIGGVHRGSARSGDVSADLLAIANNRVLTVSAGAKVFLDLPKTVEMLETLSVPVLGWQCDEFPAFHAASSGIPLTVRVESAQEMAEIVLAHWGLGGRGILLACPVPEADQIPLKELELMVHEALGRTDETTIGGAVTPAVLDHLTEVSNGRTIEANLALAENNAAIAAEISLALAELNRRPG